MPFNDDIFQRLRAATDVEVSAFARPLGTRLSHDRSVDVVALSKDYRSAAGHTIDNIRRDAHDLEYRAILRTVAKAAASAATWGDVRLNETSDPHWVTRTEDFVVASLAFAYTPDKEKIPRESKLRIKEEAVQALLGEHTDRASDGDAYTRPSAFPYFGIFNPLIIAAEFAMTPATKKIIPATAVLIHIRKRIELESTLRGE